MENSERERLGAPRTDGKGRAPRSLARSAGRDLCERNYGNRAGPSLGRAVDSLSPLWP